MAETATINYGWTMPDPGGSPNTWGTTLNGTTGKIDAKVFANEQGLVPIGSGALWFTATPPTGWILLQGQTLTRSTPYDALFALFGTTYNVGTVAADKFMLPDLRQKFPLGASATNALTVTGGEEKHQLVNGELSSHAHQITDPTHTHGANQAPHTHTDSGHAHTITDPTHAHYVATSVLTANAGVNVQAGSGWQFPGPNGAVTDARATGITGTNTGTANLDTKQPAINLVANSTGITATQVLGGNLPHNNMPPFLAVNYMVKYA